MKIITPKKSIQPNNRATILMKKKAKRNDIRKTKCDKNREEKMEKNLYI